MENYSLSFLIGVLIGALIMMLLFIALEITERTYETGVKDCLNGRIKIEYKQDTVIVR